MHTRLMESLELDFPEGKVRYGMLICSAPHNSAQRHCTKLIAVTSLLAAIENHNCSLDRIRLAADSLGKPQLSMDFSAKPVVSFSWEGDRLWAALSLDCLGLGFDASSPQDFTDRYPFVRAFGEREGKQLSRLCDSHSSWKSAMLWSAKEAAVKMVGCGFHLIDPRNITVKILGKGESACHSHVTFTIDAKLNEVRVYSIEQSWGWISFALGNKR